MDGLTVLVKASALVFVVSPMSAMGLSPTIQQIIEPLKNVRMMVVALVVHFVAAEVPKPQTGTGGASYAHDRAIDDRRAPDDRHMHPTDQRCPT